MSWTGMGKQGSGQWLLWLVSLLVLVTGVSTFLSRAPVAVERVLNRSVFNSGESGYRAWHLAMKEVGLPVGIWKKPFTELGDLPEQATMVIVDPYTAGGEALLFSETEAARLFRWVRSGNHLVFVDSFQRSGSRYLLQQLSLKLLKTQSGNQRTTFSLVTQEPLMKTFIQQPIVSETPYRLMEPGGMKHRVRYPARNVLVDESGRAVLMQFDVGRGKLTIGTTSDLGSNAFLPQQGEDNLQLFANLITMQPQPVFINEYVHGYRESADLFAFYRQNTPLEKVFIQLMLVFLFVLWLSLRPWRPALGDERRATAVSAEVGYAQAMASLYAKGGASRLAVQPVLTHIEGVLKRHYRISSEAPGELENLLGALLEQYSREQAVTPVSRKTLTDALQTARAVSLGKQSPNPQQFLAMMQHLTFIEDLLHHDATIRRASAAGQPFSPPI